MKTAPPTGSERGLLPAAFAPLVDAIDSAVKSSLSQDPFQRDAAFVSLLLPVAQAINTYFSTEIRGWENIPKHGPVLIVGNHSGGAETSDAAPLLARWVADRGAKAPIYFLGYDLLFTYPVIGPLLRKLGLLPASQSTARMALRRAAAVAVFPGGDYEVFRPWSERNRIDFGGRTGFIELALSMRVPVVPMTTHGAHQSTLVLTRGRRIAQMVGLHRLNIKVFPFIWNIPLGLTPAFVPSVQLPAKVTVQFGKPLNWSRYDRRQAKDPAVLRACSDEITSVMQSTLDALAKERPYPVLSRLNELRPSYILRRALGGSNSTGATGAGAAGGGGPTAPTRSRRAPRLRARPGSARRNRSHQKRPRDEQ